MVVSSAAQKSLFHVTYLEKLKDKERMKLHIIVQKLLFVSKRSRLDLQTSVSFLCQRVRFPDISNWAKLKRLLQFIH